MVDELSKAKQLINMLSSLKKILWRIRYAPRKFSGKPGGFEEIFKRAGDPWEFENSEFEDMRFKVMRDYLLEVGGGKVLELGCAEGHFTERIAGDCESLVCIDVSPTAIKKAWGKTGEPEYLCGDFTRDNTLLEGCYDVAIAGEILYYLTEKEIEETLKRLKTRYLITSNFIGHNRKINGIIRESDYEEIKHRAIKRFEPPQPKKTRITLWRRR